MPPDSNPNYWNGNCSYCTEQVCVCPHIHMSHHLLDKCVCQVLSRRRVTPFHLSKLLWYLCAAKLFMLFVWQWWRTNECAVIIAIFLFAFRFEIESIFRLNWQCDESSLGIRSNYYVSAIYCITSDAWFHSICSRSILRHLIDSFILRWPIGA